MTSQSYGSLNKRPSHPYMHKEDEREKATFEVVDKLQDVDKDFIYERRKSHQHEERLLSSYLNFIRQFDYLPKGVLVDTFSRAIKHIYTSNSKEKDFIESTNEVCKDLKEGN
mgnify:FL=1